MRDLMEVGYEITKTVEGELNQRKAFFEEFLKELAQEESADITPHFECVFDFIKREYVATLRLPAGPNIFDSSSCDVKGNEEKEEVKEK